jgi:hypothetical protein
LSEVGEEPTERYSHNQKKLSTELHGHILILKSEKCNQTGWIRNFDCEEMTLKTVALLTLKLWGRQVPSIAVAPKSHPRVISLTKAEPTTPATGSTWVAVPHSIHILWR